jgi:tetratricopeptide (TPR) repeat protein
MLGQERTQRRTHQGQRQGAVDRLEMVEQSFHLEVGPLQFRPCLGDRPALLPLQQAAEANPDNVNAVYNLGLTLLLCGRSADAVGQLQRAAALKPDHAHTHYNLGVALQTLGQIQPAIAALRSACRLAPKLADAYYRLGELFTMTQQLSESAAWYRRGAAAAGNTTFGRTCEARALIIDDRCSEAADLLRRALARDAQNVTATLVLAQALAFIGDLDGAVACYERALTLAADAPGPLVSAFSGLVRVKRLTNADRPLTERITECLQLPRLSDMGRMQLHFALGKAFDDLRDYEAAMRHYDLANGIRGGFSTFERIALERFVDTVCAHCDAAFFVDRAGLGSDDETPVLVIGMPRSGTTLVEQLLSSHPDVAGAGELTFWMDNWASLARISVEQVGRDAAQRVAGDYLAQLRGYSTTAARVTDKMPFNFLYLGLARLVFPKARIIHCRRHPIDTCLSMYFANFEIARAFTSSREHLVFYYQHYLRLMDHWRRVLPPDRFIEVDYETLTTDFEPQARRLVAFCGLYWDDACLHPERNEHAIKTASMWQARQPVYRTSVERWRHYEPWLGALRELMPAEAVA